MVHFQKIKEIVDKEICHILRRNIKGIFQQNILKQNEFEIVQIAKKKLFLSRNQISKTMKHDFVYRTRILFETNLTRIQNLNLNGHNSLPQKIQNTISLQKNKFVLVYFTASNLIIVYKTLINVSKNLISIHTRELFQEKKFFFLKPELSTT